MTRIKGYARVSGAVVNTDDSQLQIIKQKRAQKKEFNQIRSEIQMLRDLVTNLKNRVEELERRGG